MNKLYTCIYCGNTCKIEKKDGKIFMHCTSCGTREATPKLMEKLERNYKKTR